MLYPFAVVTLYTLREVTRKKREKLGNGRNELTVFVIFNFVVQKCNSTTWKKRSTH